MISVMAICEVVKNYSYIKDCGWCLVVKDESIVTTRYLLVWKSDPNSIRNNGNNGNKINANKLTYPKIE